MNLGSLIEEIKQHLDDCGICWDVVVGGRQDYLNMIKEVEPDVDGNCCALLGVLDIRSRSNFVHNDYGVLKRSVNWDIQMFAGIPSRLDIQFYNEIDKDKIEESKWVKYIYPIQCCIEDLPLIFCDYHNCSNETSLEIVKFETNLKINYLDINADGWLINATFREYKE